MSLIVVFNNNLAAIDSMSRCRADVVVTAVVIFFTDANIGQHPCGVGDGNRVRVNIMTNNVAHLAQGFAIHITKERERFIGDIERQFGLSPGDSLFFPFHALH